MRWHARQSSENRLDLLNAEQAIQNLYRDTPKDVDDILSELFSIAVKKLTNDF